MSFWDAPASNAGFPSSTPPVAISVLKEFRNAHPNEGPLPASERSCQYGGSSIENDRDGSIRPLARSNFQNVTSPR